MLAELREHLEAKGIAPDVLDDFNVAENEVEVDALTEALDELSKAMKKDEKEAPAKQNNLFGDDDMSDEDMNDDEDDEDEDLEDLERGYYKEAMKALASGTDEVIAGMEKRMSAVMKGLEAVLGEMKKMKMSSDEMNKSLTASLNQVAPPRAVTSAPIVTQSTEPQGPSRNDMIKKGLKLLQSNDVNSTRKSAIRGVIAQLEAGVPVSNVSHLIDLD